MKNEEIKRIIDDTYDDSREDSIRSMIGDFYNRRMLSTAVLIWAVGLIFMAGAIYSAVRFFEAGETKAQILYATLFLCLFNLIGLLKIFAWQIIHRNGIRREIKRLELRVAELAGALGKST
jgi:hypothetical protein